MSTIDDVVSSCYEEKRFMAITVISDNEDGLTIKFDNGDRDAVDDILREWRFRGIQSLIRFAIAIFLKADQEKKVYVLGEDGSKVGLTPSDQLLSGDDSSPTV